MVYLVTIYDLNNYGNRFQNYALSTVLNRFGDDVITIPDIIPSYYTNIYRMIRHLGGEVYRHILLTEKHKRRNRFLKFTRKNINTASCFVLKTLLSNEHASYVVGSDQVWNPYFNHLSELDTLSFLKDGKGISYAASFGVDDLPEEYAPQLAEIGKHFKAVSVREASGKKILEPYVEDVQVHVDPTLLLTPNEWEKVMQKPRHFTKNKYVVLYFLGQLNETRRSQINEFANRLGYEIIEIMDKSSVYYSYGPAEFLWVMQHAEAVFTDSFHGCVFSFLFDKPFVVYDREDNNQNMASRMETFLPWFHLEDRTYTGNFPEDLLEHDYSKGYQLLEVERKRSNDYLNQYLSQ